MIPDHGCLICVINHIDMTVVISVRVASVRSIDLDSFIDALASAVKGSALGWITNDEILRVLASIEFNK